VPAHHIAAEIAGAAVRVAEIERERIQEMVARGREGLAVTGGVRLSPIDDFRGAIPGRGRVDARASGSRRDGECPQDAAHGERGTDQQTIRFHLYSFTRATEN